MQWRSVLILSLVGACVGLFSLFGLYPLWVEAVVWGLVGVLWVGTYYWLVPPHPFLHGAVTAFLGGFCAILIQVLFLDMYLANQPALAAGYEASAGRFVGGLRAAIFFGGLVASAVYALIVGAATHLAIPAALRETEKSEE